MGSAIRSGSWMVLVLALGCQGGDQGGNCTLIGCGESLELELTYAGPEADLVDGTGRVCLGAVCSEATFRSLPAEGGGLGEPLRGPLVGSLQLDRTSGGLRLKAGLRLEEQVVAVGDVYTLTYRIPDDQILLEGQWIARAYQESWPNGPRCPPPCYQAEVEPVPARRSPSSR